MECLKSSSNLTFAFNIMVHVTVLFTILSLFYFTFVSKYQLSNYRDTIQNGLQNVINPLSEKMTPTEKVKAAEFLDFIGTKSSKTITGTTSEERTVIRVTTTSGYVRRPLLYPEFYLHSPLASISF